MRAEERERRRQTALKRFEGVPTKRKAVLRELQAFTLANKTQISVTEAAEIAAKAACHIEYVKQIAKKLDMFRPLNSQELVAQRRAAGSYQHPDSRASKVRALLRDEPQLTRREIMERTGIHSSSLCLLIKAMGANPPREQAIRQAEFDLDQIAQDTSIQSIMVRIRTLTRQKYRISRIVQLLDLPEKIVRAYVKALPNYRFTKADVGKRMTEEDVEKAYELWKMGSTPATIAKKLGFTHTQIEKRVLALRRALGEA